MSVYNVCTLKKAEEGIFETIMKFQYGLNVNCSREFQVFVCFFFLLNGNVHLENTSNFYRCMLNCCFMYIQQMW